MFLYFYCTIFYIGIQGVFYISSICYFQNFNYYPLDFKRFNTIYHLNNEIITNFSNKGYKSNIFK